MGVTVNLKARSLQALWLSPAGWLKGMLFTGPDTTSRTGPWGHRSTAATGFCLVGGALQVCDGDENRAIRLVRTLDRRIRKLFPTRPTYQRQRALIAFDAWNNVVNFNNAPSTTFEEIQLLVRGVRRPKAL